MSNCLKILSFVVLLAGCQPETEATRTPPPASASAQSAATAESERLNQWFAVKFEERLQMSPSWLTSLGRKERYDEYDEQTEAEADRQLAWYGATVAELRSQFAYDALDAETQTSYDLWIYQYERTLEGRDYRRSNYIFTQMLGPQSGVAQFLVRFHKVDDEGDMIAYNKRIGAISSTIGNLLARARTHAEEGVRPPVFAYEGVITEATTLITGVPFTDTDQDSPLWADAKTKISTLFDEGKIDSVTASNLREGAKQALLGQFQPAYEELIDWFSTDIDNADAVARGVGSLPGGAAFYDFRLRAMTTTDLNAEQIHEIGLSEVARIRTEMKVIKTRVGFTGDLHEFFAFLKADDRFFYPNTDEGRQGYVADSEEYLDFIKQRLPDYFGILPQAGLVVKRVEAFREQDGAPQHYSRGSPDGSRPGVYYAHLSDMRAMPKDQMEAVAYHEGIPGHHMQISIAQELTSVPQFRTQSGFTAYSEGWGLYAELLAKEMGAYEDEYSEFGRLITEMWRAIRLVVDTGLHSKGWTEEGAIAYFKENSAISDAAIKAEVRRYIVWPGQATAYKIGMMKILDLRAYAKAELGDEFDIRDFHDTILGGGPLPLPVLQRRVERWVEKLQS